MEILFTGASSFTGMWFVKELAANGHRITAIFSRKLEDYTGLRLERIKKILPLCQPLFSCRFGEPAFLEALEKNSWDLFCHHAADVENYKSNTFDVVKALANNTKNVHMVLKTLKESGCSKILLTGSVFEAGEGEGSDLLRAASPYGLSKGLTAEIFRYYAQLLGCRLGKFVIPNPFGPYEEPKFTTYLITSWFAGKTPVVQTPAYFRDNIPVTLLAKAYRDFAERLAAAPGFEQVNPSFYVGNQGAFAALFAREMEQRLGIPCKITLKEQVEFSEPAIRINSDKIAVKLLKWSEAKAWDELAAFYQATYGTTR